MKQKKKTGSIAGATTGQSPGRKLKLDLAAIKRQRVLAAVLIFFAMLLYSNTLSHGYVLDDFSAVRENNIVRQGTSAIPEIFQTSYRQGYLSVKDGLYRPLSLAMYALEWEWFPDTPSVSHFVNVVLYGLTAWVLFQLLVLLASWSGPATVPWAEWMAFLTTLLFLAHPLHVEVVANIKSRDELLCFLLVMLAFLMVLRYLQSGNIRQLWLGMAAYFLSLLSKETSITFLALLPLGLYLLIPVPLPKILRIAGAFLACAVLYMIIRVRVLDGALADDSVSIADNVVVGAKTLNTRLGTAFLILGRYIHLLFFPHPLSYDYSYAHIEVTGMNDLVSILSLLIFIAIGIFAALIIFRRWRGKDSVDDPLLRWMAYGILFFLATIFLFSNLVLTIGTSMGDRLMYFPSFGFCLVVGVLITTWIRPSRTGLAAIVSEKRTWPLLLVVLLFSVKTWSRNADWKDNYTLYSKDVQVVPNSVKAHYYLGLELIKVVADKEKDPQIKTGIYKQGIAELERSVAILPSFASAYTQMGVAYYRMRDFENAIKNYEKASQFRPDDAITLNNIGTVYFEWQKYPEAAQKFRQALQTDGRFVDAHMNLGSVLGMTGDFKNAIASFENALRYAPDNARAYYFIGVTYQNMGDKGNADKYFGIAEKMDPGLKRP